MAAPDFVGQAFRGVTDAIDGKGRRKIAVGWQDASRLSRRVPIHVLFRFGCIGVLLVVLLRETTRSRRSPHTAERGKGHLGKLLLDRGKTVRLRAEEDRQRHRSVLGKGETLDLRRLLVPIPLHLHLRERAELPAEAGHGTQWGRPACFEVLSTLYEASYRPNSPSYRVNIRSHRDCCTWSAVCLSE